MTVHCRSGPAVFDGPCSGQLLPFLSPFPHSSATAALLPQYHPEASPGPHDADICFAQYIDMLKAERAATKVAA